MAKKFLSAFLFVISGLLISGCAVYNLETREFFKEYTETAAIEKYEILGNYTTSPAGIPCLSSDDVVKINFYLRNPQNYTLNSKYSMNNYTLVQSADKAYVTVTFPKSDLVAFDTDPSKKDISASVSLQEVNTLRTFESFPITLHVNSVPKKVEGLCFQLTQASGGKYIICFFMPNLAGTVHAQDTKKIVITKDGSSSETFYFSGTTFYTDAEMTTAESRFTTTKPTMDQNEVGFVFDENICPSAYTPVYFTCNWEPKQPGTTDCTITLVDDEGLSASSSISNTSKQLTTPVISNITELAGGVEVSEQTGTYEVTISHDGKDTGGDSCGTVNISYDVYKINGTQTLYKSGTAVGQAKIALPKGKYKITATASKPYFISSTEYDSSVTGQAPSGIYIKPLAIFYVSQSGSNETGYGAIAAPYRSIQKAVDEFEAGVSASPAEYSADDVCKIYVMSDITPCEYDIFFENLHPLVYFRNSNEYIIEGYGNKYTVSAEGSNENIRRVFVNESSTKVTLRNLVVKKGYTKDHAAGLYQTKSDSTVILENVDFTENRSKFGPAVSISAGTVEYVSGKVYGNESSGVGSAFNATGTLILGSETGRVNVYDNICNAQANPCAVNFRGTVKINNATIYNNKDSSGNQANVFLKSEKTLTILRNLSGNKIGITTVTAPTAAAPVTFTSGYGTNNGSENSVFVSDINKYGINISGSEATLCITGASTDNPSYNPVYKLALDKTYKNPGVAATVTLSAKDSEGNAVTPSSYALKLIQNGEEIVTSNSATITVPAWLPEGTYTIKAEAVIGGVKYDGEFKFYNVNAVNVASEAEFSRLPVVTLSEDITFSNSSETVSLTDRDNSQNRSIITKVDNSTKIIFGNGTTVVANTLNNKKITVDDANNLFLYAINDSVVEINNIDFTATAESLNDHNYNGIFARAESGTVITFNYCTLSEFWESSDGAGSAFVAESGGKLIFNNCTFSDFSTYKSNGCSAEVIKVYDNSSCEIYDCSFTGIGSKTNCASSASITNHGDIKIYRTTFNRTYGQEGGAIQNNYKLYAEDVTFKNGTQNYVYWRNCGAGLKLNPASVRAEFVRCTFEGNVSGDDYTNNPNGGGGIAVLGNTVIFDSCTFTNNSSCTSSSYSYGGAIWIWNGENASDAVLDVTFKDNGSVISVQDYIDKYMSGNSAMANHGKNIYLLYDGNSHGTVRINGTEYTASQNWE